MFDLDRRCWTDGLQGDRGMQWDYLPGIILVGFVLLRVMFSPALLDLARRIF